MAKITVDFSDVETFESLGEGIYTGHIDYMRHRPAREAGKSDQLSVCLVCDEGESKGERTWQNLYFSPKAIWRMAKFFALFGIDSAELDVDDEEPYDVLDPDLAGEPVLFSVKRDGTYNGQPSFKAEVVEWLGGNQKPLPKSKPAAAEELEDIDETPAPKKTFGKPAEAKRPLR